MSYKKIFELKFKKGCSTTDLIRKFPKEASRVREIALLHVPIPLLRKTLSEEKLLDKILFLKRKFL